MPRYTEKELAELYRNNPDLQPDRLSTNRVIEYPGTKVVAVPAPGVNVYVFDGTQEKRTNKYGNRKVTADGHTFDSAKEYRRYLELKRREETGEITHLWLQPKYELLPAFTDSSGKKHRQTFYVADFLYYEKGQAIVEDVKSVATERNAAFRLKWKWVQYLYRDRNLVFRLVI